jgi:hypothetical protein
MTGHLLEAHVRQTLEIVRTDWPGHLPKRYDADSGLALIDLDLSAASIRSEGDLGCVRPRGSRVSFLVILRKGWRPRIS